MSDHMLNSSHHLEPLSELYHPEVDHVAKPEWPNLLSCFEDATIYQTWSYGQTRWGERNLSHFVLKKGPKVIAVAQVVIKSVPFISAGFAYIPWGPVWHLKEEENSAELLCEISKALREEYVERRGLLLRLTPNEIDDDRQLFKSMIEKAGFLLKRIPYRTLLIDLTPSMSEIYQKLARRWRRALKKAAESNLRVIEGTEDDLFAKFVPIYEDMVSRKKFIPGVDIKEFRQIQRDLPESSKMKIMVCEANGVPVSALVASLIGNKGIGLLGATGTNGLNLGGFHLLNWKMMEWMKFAGARYYDFGGYDPEKNPHTGTFKEGLPGKDVCHIGQFESCQNSLSSFLVKTRERLNTLFSTAKFEINSLRTAFFDKNSDLASPREQSNPEPTDHS